MKNQTVKTQQNLDVVSQLRKEVKSGKYIGYAGYILINDVDKTAYAGSDRWSNRAHKWLLQKGYTIKANGKDAHTELITYSDLFEAGLI